MTYYVYLKEDGAIYAQSSTAPVFQDGVCLTNDDRIAGDENRLGVFEGNIAGFAVGKFRYENGTAAEIVVPPPAPPTREKLKQAREIAVASIEVTTQAGHTFDGDETSQTRMARAVIALNAQPQNPVPTVNWVLADNTVIQATAAELTEALALAGAAQAAIWVI